MSNNINIIRSESPKAKPDENNLGFGKYYTDHMLVIEYSRERGWHDATIQPYAPIVLDPAAMVLHYGQTIFEGLKAFRTKENDIILFRPDKNMERMNRSTDRLEMPQVDEEFVVEAIKALVEVERDWVPSAEGTSLYIRPFIIATEPCVGVRPSDYYKLIVILSPVGAYYADGLKPVKINVESKYVRAVRGGMGDAKTAGNYAASLKAQAEAKEQGYAQVLWLDGVEQKYVEEVGSMNVFFKIDGEVVTPELNGSILQGVTRDSVIQLLKHWNVPVVERRVSIEEIEAAHAEGKLEEVFGTGTAAVVSPVGELNWKSPLTINGGKIGDLTQRLYDTLTGIQTGKLADPFGWTVRLKRDLTISNK